MTHKPSAAFIGASWVALGTGVIAFLVGLWNVELDLHMKGYFFTVLMFGLFAAVSVQKCVRDRMEGIPVTHIYYGLSWTATILALVLMISGLWHTLLNRAEKGFFGISFMMSMFSAIAVQKNTRDVEQHMKESHQ